MIPLRVEQNIGVFVAEFFATQKKRAGKMQGLVQILLRGRGICDVKVFFTGLSH